MTIGQKPLQKIKTGRPRLGETADTMDQIHQIPRRDNKKRGRPQERSLQLRSPPSCRRQRQRTPQAEVEDMLKEPHGSPFGILAAPLPRGTFHQETSSGEECRRPRRGKTLKPTRGRAPREHSLLPPYRVLCQTSAKGIPWEPQARYGRLPCPLEREPVAWLA